MPRSVVGVGREQLGRCGQPAAVQRIEPGQDRRGGCQRELLADHLDHERTPQVARQAVEQAVGIQRGVGVDEHRHPRIRRAQHARGRPPSGPAPPAHRGRSRTTSAGGLVVAQPEEARLPQPTVARPLGEADLGDQLGAGPVRAARDRSRIDERRLGRLQLAQAGRRGRAASPRCSPVPTFPA